MKRLTHIAADGRAQMVDVSAKPVSARAAVAQGRIALGKETLALISKNEIAKGDVIATARLAGIQAAKRTAHLIPLCHTIPLSEVKIDKSFIDDLTRNYKSTAIVCTIVTLACGLDMQVTVEGVETREQFERLKSLGVNFAQGFLMGRPVPIDELERQPQVYRSQHDAA